MGAGNDILLERTGNTVRVSGELTKATAASALQQSDAWFKDGEVVPFDLAGLGHCDSAAIAVLLEWQRRAARNGHSVQYRNAPERLLQLARISELDGILGLAG